MSYTTFVRIYCLLCLYLVSNCHGETSIRIERIKCVELDTSIANITKCYTKHISRAITESTLNITLLEEFKTVKVKFYFKKKINNKYVPFYRNDIVFDGCAFLENTRISPVARYLFAAFKGFSNLNHSCPYTGYILIDRCRMDMNTFKWVPLPVGEYFVNSEWDINGKRRHDIGAFFTVNLQ